MTGTSSIVVAALTSATLIAVVVLVAWPWRIEATLKAITNESAISLAGGLEVAGLSASAAAVWGGPGVVAIHLRGRELWRRDLRAKRTSESGGVGRLLERVKRWLIARTDMGELPELGVRVLLGLRDVSLHGDVAFGSSDPVIMGKTAAWLYPIAGVLAPFGALDVTCDWSGKSRLDGAIDLSFRVVPARLAREGLRFAWRHVHPTMPDAITTR